MSGSPAAAARALARDVVLRAHTPALRLAFVQATGVAAAGCGRFHVANPRAAELYAKTLAAAALLASLLRDEERVIVQLLDERGPVVRRIYAEAMACGEVRGFVAGPGVGESDRAAWGAALVGPSGTLTVSRILYGGAAPVQSTVPVAGGDVESDLRRYFEDSEQVPTALRLEVDVASAADGGAGGVRVAYAGGALAQAIAAGGGHDVSGWIGPPPSSLGDIAARLAGGDARYSLRAAHAAGVPLAAAVARLIPELAGAPVVSAADAGAGVGALVDSSPRLLRTPLDFFCRCSKARFVARLRAAPELLATGLDGPTALTCAYCNAAYEVRAEDLAQVEAAAQAGPARPP